MILNNLIYEFLESPIGQGVLSKLKTRNVSELYFHGLTDSAKGFFLTCLISSVFFHLWIEKPLIAFFYKKRKLDWFTSYKIN